MSAARPINSNLQTAIGSHRRGIYLDFEGVGPARGDDISPRPHLAGVYRPHLGKSAGGQYHCYFFEPSWQPVNNGCGTSSSLSDFDDFVHMLVDECERGGRFIYFWSQHEGALIKDLVSPELHARFDKYSANALKFARRFKNKRDLEIEEKAPKLLNTYLAALAPKSSAVVAPKIGAAESCRRIDRYCSKAQKWKSWTAHQKACANDLVRYNKEDCLAVYRICRRVLPR